MAGYNFFSVEFISELDSIARASGASAHYNVDFYVNFWALILLAEILVKHSTFRVPCRSGIVANGQYSSLKYQKNKTLLKFIYRALQHDLIILEEGKHLPSLRNERISE